jgi:hypothetical protein
MSELRPGLEIAQAFKDFLVGLRGFEPMCIAARFSVDTNRRGVDGSMCAGASFACSLRNLALEK